MMRSALLALSLFLLAAGPAPALACPTGPMQAARSLDEVRAAAAGITAAGTACGARQRDWAGRLAAARFHTAAEAAVAAGDRAAAMRLLNEGIAQADLWQSLALRADLRQRVPGPGGRIDYAAASLDYQAALNGIAASDPAADPVPVRLIASIFRRAEQTRLLADQPMASPRTRSGAAGGLAARRVRSFVVVAVAMPIQFVFDNCGMTPGGMRAAVDMWEMLKEEGMPAIRLIGHTDPVGPDDYNLRLSICRARAVAEFLAERGYPAERITTEGRGERDPLSIEGGDAYTEAQRHQMLRRVELQRP
ncbi:OmpA family protein [Falsiroseomonas stagni]|uniref:Outer membrane protein OmpA n=1 Tax=Falsiroseomonas stagni DSM 19981 TaxID=1123062 RepID=A0A1I4F9V5_9PROT|nr:OmpA family protein [Falsiroseomonas stagni]SFL13171.1 Outer membrane protein OmpA [Falsiroseomonas stagni DSM 19981]